MTDFQNQFQTVQLSQGTIRYCEFGSGEPIVFIHGLLVNGLLWRKVVPHLAKRYRCIVPDLPLGGHEAPMKADADLSPTGLAKIIADFLSELDLQNVTLVANDTGGAITQIVMTEHPERIARVVLTNCDCFENFLPKMFRPMQWGAHVPGFVWLIAQLMRFDFLRRSPLAFGWLAKRPVPKGIADAYLHQLINNGAIRREVGKILRGISTKYTLTAARKLTNFNRPVLLAWAREDRFFSLSDAEKLQRILPNARLAVIEDSYAFVSEDQPEQLAALIDEFMQENKASDRLSSQRISLASA